MGLRREKSLEMCAGQIIPINLWVVTMVEVKEACLEFSHVFIEPLLLLLPRTTESCCRRYK